MKVARLTVKAGWHQRLWCPVEAQLPGVPAVALDKLVLWDTADGMALPVQAWRTDDGAVKVGWVIPSLAAQEVRVYELRTVDDGAVAVTDGVQLEEVAPGKLRITVGGRYFATYNYGSEVVRPYLYPVLAAEGVGITRNWPMVDGVAGESTDHPHHKGIYTAQDDINGHPNWGEGPGHGWQIHKGFTKLFSGPVAGGFTAELDWTDNSRNVYMTETRRMTFYLTPMRARLFDYEVTLHASHGDLVIGDTKEGGLLSVRVASSMEAQRQTGGVITNGCGGVCAGPVETETWGKRAPWCDYSGPIGNGVYGITLMDHLSNPRYPTHWHVRAYGLMTANCFGLHDFTGDPNNRADMPIPAGQSVTWRYRVLVHHGDVKAAKADIHFQDFVYPPAVEVRML